MRRRTVSRGRVRAAATLASAWRRPGGGGQCAAVPRGRRRVASVAGGVEWLWRTAWPREVTAQ